MFKRYHDPQENMQYLKSMLHLLKNPETDIIVPMTKRGMEKSLFMFDQKMSIKSLVKLVLEMTRNRVKSKTKPQNLPRYKTFLKQQMSSSPQDKNKFSIDEKDLDPLRIKFSRRQKSKITATQANNLLSEKGRIIRYSNQKRGKIALTPTLINAIRQGHYLLDTNKFTIKKEDFLYPIFAQNMIYNILLVLDTSKSIAWVIPHIEKIISALSSNISQARDKVGLVTFNHDLAQVYHYPTLNVKQVIGTINKMEAEGQTPLGDGLNLAWQVLCKEQYRLPGMKNMIILISDCYPEPLEGGHKDLLAEPSYKLVLQVSEKIAREKFGLVIINPAAREKEKEDWNIKLIKQIVATTKAKYIKIQPETEQKIFGQEEAFIDQQKLTNLTNQVMNAKMDL
ncbi:MAG: VWA domain-containing protein [Candidatus Cloacimonadales bacterium]